jgi:bifunctional DNase/RNase
VLEGVFYSKLICNSPVGGGSVYEIDSRTSDAIALAIRLNAPVYIYKEIMDRVGIILEEDEDYLAPDTHEETHRGQKTPAYGHYSAKELEKLLKEAIQHENYEKAAKIRDELKNKQKK